MVDFQKKVKRKKDNIMFDAFSCSLSVYYNTVETNDQNK